MQLRNQFDIETRYGLRTFALYEGDITVLSEDVDVLALSTFSGCYTPSPGTVIGALSTNLGINIQHIERDYAYNRREAFSIWVSTRLCGFTFERILCLEINGSQFDFPEVLENLFIGINVLEAKVINFRSVALPAPDAGLQQQDPKQVMHLLLPQALRALQHSARLARILFVEQNPERVAILNETMNNLLPRPRVALTQSQGKPETLRHSVDFRTVYLRGQTFSLTSKQAEAVQFMYERHQRGIHESTQDYILTEIESTSQRLRDLFRSTQGAWGTLIIPGSRRGMYRLNIFD